MGNSQLKGDPSGFFPETHSGLSGIEKWLFVAPEESRRVLSEKGEAKGPEKLVQWLSLLSNPIWKGWDCYGRGQDREKRSLGETVQRVERETLFNPVLHELKVQEEGRREGRGS